jgi:hypothetical protein
MDQNRRSWRADGGRRARLDFAASRSRKPRDQRGAMTSAENKPREGAQAGRPASRLIDPLSPLYADPTDPRRRSFDRTVGEHTVKAGLLL